MTDQTPQMTVWSGEFGKAYTDRNVMSPRDLDALYERRFGVTRRVMNDEFIGALDRGARILEVGANVGNQLVCLQEMGFTNLYGIELQQYAVELSKQYTKGVNLLQGSVFDIPFKDGYFDLVFTSGVLIHVAPTDIGRALGEIHRCTRSFIWGMEYYSPQYQEVSYRGHEGLLWKADFANLYMRTCGDLRIVKHRIFDGLDGPTQDAMFLLAKAGAMDA